MLLHMLKQDLMKRKGINAILFIFITLATVFLASSVNNILAVTSAVDYYMDYANVPDVQVVLSSEQEKDTMREWLDTKKSEGEVNTYVYEKMIMLTDKGVMLADENDVVFDGKSASLYLSPLSDDYNLVYDQNNQRIDLKSGEVAISRASAERNHLEIGDRIKIRVNEQERTFTLASIVKDAAYGNDMVGMIRLIVNTEEFASLENDALAFGMFDVMCNDTSAFMQSVNNESFSTVLNLVNRELYTMVYSFDMIMAGLLIVIGICLILIALLVLRFTLTFTIEEVYQEIGVLKAVGLRNWSIKKLYLLKYFLLVALGATIGAILSFPVSSLMIDGISKNMIMESSGSNYLVNIICAVIVVILVLLFCYLCTHKLNHVSAITAIRGGSKGERYHEHRGIALSKRKFMRVTCYLGLNDILSKLKSYAVLIITFCISFILITIPLNTVNTMKSPEMASKFGVDKEVSVILNEIEQGESKYLNVADLENGMIRVKQELKDAGYNASLSANSISFYKFSLKGEDESTNTLSVQLHGDDTNYLEYTEGSAPKLENEVAFSEKFLEEKGWQIGDRVEMQMKDQKQELIITASFSDYMQLGKSARINPNLNCDNEVMFDYNVMVKVDTDLNQQELKASMEEQFPKYNWITSQDVVNINVGGLQDMLEQMLLPMTAMLCGVIILITLLMERLFITREKGEIAMLKSVGFSKAAIRNWQLIRMISVVIVSMIISIPLSLLSNQYALKPLFAMMGADVTIQVDALSAYIIYPGILLLGIIIATYIATLYIRKINIREMNNIE